MLEERCIEAARRDRNDILSKIFSLWRIAPSHLHLPMAQTLAR
jgi:hypothetical protein